MKIDDFKLERFFAANEFAVPYVLCGSDCQTLSVAEILAFEEGAERGLLELPLSYTESQGSPELRRDIAELYESVEPDQILVFSGAEEGIFAFANAVLAPGDHVIVQFPAYQSLFEVARAAGCRVTLWKANADRGWEPDIEQLRRAIEPETKAIIVNSPHNPTGYHFTPEQYEIIVGLAREAQAYLFSDEVYRLLEYGGAERLPAGADRYELALSLGVMSKSFGLAGLRIGWLATRDEKALERIAAFKDYTTICNSAPSEFLAGIALRHWKRVVERNRALVERNVELADGFFRRNAHLFRWVKPKAGSVALAEVLFDGGAESFCERLAAEAGVLLLPGSVYDLEDRYLRIGLGRQNLPEALEKMEAFVSAARD